MNNLLDGYLRNQSLEILRSSAASLAEMRVRRLVDQYGRPLPSHRTIGNRLEVRKPYSFTPKDAA